MVSPETISKPNQPKNKNNVKFWEIYIDEMKRKKKGYFAYMLYALSPLPATLTAFRTT